MTRKPVLASLFLVLFIAPTVRAGGLNLRWDHCLPDGGAANKTFACDTNAGAETLVATFFPPAQLILVAGVTTTIEIATASPALPAWWGLVNVGGCRSTALTMSPYPPDGSTAACEDWSAGPLSAAITSYDSAIGPNDATLVVAASNPPGATGTLCGCVDFAAATLTISHEKTVGAGSCGGCQVPACIHIKSVEIAIGTTGKLTMTGAAGPGSDIATWQGGAGVPALPGGACAGAVPVRASSWGAVKSLYR